jgi:hypothetical protein
MKAEAMQAVDFGGGDDAATQISNAATPEIRTIWLIKNDIAALAGKSLTVTTAPSSIYPEAVRVPRKKCKEIPDNKLRILSDLPAVTGLAIGTM